MLPVVRSSATGRDLAVLCAGAIAALTAVVEIGAVVQAHLDRFSGDGDLAVFSGWQVDAVEVAGMVLALALLVASAIVVRRFFRRLEGRTPYRRVAILIALLPGLALGLAARAGTRSAMDTASEHTSAASAAEADFRAMFSTEHPPYPSIDDGIAAPPEMAARMLTAADMGAGWYTISKPDATLLSLPADTPAGQLGGMVMVKAGLQQATRVQNSWKLRALALEAMTQFPTAQAAARYLDEQRRQLAQCANCPPTARTWTAVRVGGVRVLEYAGAHSRRAIFVVGNNEFTIAMAQIDAPSEQAIVAAAVRRAK